jgi:cathepsin X
MKFIKIGIIFMVFLLLLLLLNNYINKNDKVLNENGKKRFSEYIHTEHPGHGVIPKRTKNYELPIQWDWRNISNRESKIWSNMMGVYLPPGNYCGTVKNQHMPTYCGSCYVFASVSALEDRYNILRSIKKGHRDNDLHLSTQHIINCLAKFQNKDTCRGGHPSFVYKLIYDNGIPAETCQPYTGIADSNACKSPYCWTSAPFDMTCQDIGLPKVCHDQTKACCAIYNRKMFGISGYHNTILLEDGIEERINKVKHEIFLHGPVTAGISSRNIESLENKGIVDRKVCDNRGVDHIIELIGWKIIKGSEYWIIRNSWGIDWSDEGFAYVPLGIDCLGILDWGFQAAYPLGWDKIVDLPYVEINNSNDNPFWESNYRY